MLAKSVTTAEPPDTELLHPTVAAALAAKKPFVVTFATPLYCQSRTCGPVVQVVQAVAKRWQGKGVDFIHVEIYKDNDPAKGTNRWVNQWNLPTEPFTFVVDRTGIIRTKIEGAFSTGELDAAVKKVAALDRPSPHRPASRPSRAATCRLRRRPSTPQAAPPIRRPG